MSKFKVKHGEGPAPMPPGNLERFIAENAITYEDASESERDDQDNWHIVGEEKERTGLLYIVRGGGTKEHVARRIAQLINQAGGSVEAWTPESSGQNKAYR